MRCTVPPGVRSAPCILLLAVVCSTASTRAVAPPGGDDLVKRLQIIVDWGAQQFNTSYSFAATGPDGTIYAAAAGTDDRRTGSPVTVNSKYPAGSLTKPTAATGLLKLWEAGKLDLDEPIYSILDPWFAAQTPPVDTLLSQWHGDKTVLNVTTRHLISMTGGLQDYNDAKLEKHSEFNPTLDVLPIEYLTDEWCPKGWLFPPGGNNPSPCPVGHKCDAGARGVAYSSNGFVLAGMVLAASSGAPSWDKLDQLAALHLSPPLLETEFMHTGACSQYPGVVHQYGLCSKNPAEPTSAGCLKSEQADALVATHRRGAVKPRSQWLTERSSNLKAENACESRSIDPKTGKKRWVKDTLVGASVVNITVPELVAILPFPAPEAYCCSEGGQVAKEVHGAIPIVAWSYDPKTKNCTIYAAVYAAAPSLTVTSGPIIVPQTPSKPGQFYDLYDESCLNGWTMGNIAITASDAASFFYQLSQSRLGDGRGLVKQSTWEMMTQFNPVSAGSFAVCDLSNQDSCLLYGTGLLSMPTSGPKSGSTGVSWRIVGHAGEDWGSSCNDAGFTGDICFPPQPAGTPCPPSQTHTINMTTALATNSVLGMNYSLSLTANSEGQQTVACLLMMEVVHFLDPTFPSTTCNLAVGQWLPAFNTTYVRLK